MEIEEIEILEGESLEDLEQTMHQVVTRQLEIGKEVKETQIVLDKTLPYLLIKVHENSRLSTLVKEALESTFEARIKRLNGAEDLVELQESTRPKQISVGISIQEKEKVIGKIEVSQVRYVYNLIRHMDTSLETEDGIFAGSHILAYI